MTQITIAQWLLNQQYPQSGGQLMPINVPRYQIVSSKKFYGHYDVLDTHTGKR